MAAAVRLSAGRPPATTHARIEEVSFDLFARQGFDETTLDQISAALGVGRRTLFRYFPSKNDIPWGQFDASLAQFRNTLAATSADLTLFDAVNSAVIEFNRFDPAAMPQHRQRMTLILRTPALQAHSVLRYEQWRAVIANYVSDRLRIPADSLLPRTVGHMSLALALSAYEQWLDGADESLEAILKATARDLREYVNEL